MRKIQLSCLANKIKYLLFFGKVGVSFWDNIATVAAQRKRERGAVTQLLCWRCNASRTLFP